MRTIVRDNYDDEINQYKNLQISIDKKYPNISYIICFIIPNQKILQYYKNLDNITFLFTLNNIKSIIDNIKEQYKPIFDFIINKNLFDNIPKSNDIKIINSISRLWLVDGYPIVNYIEK